MAVRASLVTQTVKNLPAMWETRVQFLGQENPLEKEMDKRAPKSGESEGELVVRCKLGGVAKKNPKTVVSILVFVLYCFSFLLWGPPSTKTVSLPQKEIPGPQQTLPHFPPQALAASHPSVSRREMVLLDHLWSQTAKLRGG